MTALIFLAVLSIAGIGAAFWLLKSEQESGGVSLINKAEPLEATPESTEKPEQPAPTVEETGPKSSLISSTLTSIKEKLSKIKQENLSKTTESPSLIKKLLDKLNLGKKNVGSNNIADVGHLPSFADKAEEKREPSVEESPTGTASITTEPIQEPIQETAPAQEEKYEKLESMLKEKGAELEEAKKSLDNELKNRKEFSEVKDVLEQEIRDLKDKFRSVQSERDEVKNESSSCAQRIIQLKERVLNLEKNLEEKDEKINDLVKRLQTFASPPTASTPPIAESPVEETATEELPEKPIEPPVAEEPKPTEEPQENEGGGAGGAPEAPQDEEPTQMSDSQEPDNQDEAPEAPEQEESFLKLQPDVLSQEPKQKKGSIAAEIERSLEPDEPAIPEQTDQTAETDDSGPDKEVSADGEEPKPGNSNNENETNKD